MTTDGDTFPIQYGVMKDAETSWALTPGKFLENLPNGCYVRVSDLPGTPNSAKLAASRAAARGDIAPVAKGLYFKGRRTRYGIATPAAEDVALEVLGRRGVGPAGVSAARALGLTTQVPASTELATIFRAPAGIRDVHFVKRNNIARVDLTYLEIAVLEVLRTWRFTVDGGWRALVDAVRSRVDADDVRLDVLLAVTTKEHNSEVRADARKLFRALELP